MKEILVMILYRTERDLIKKEKLTLLIYEVK